MTTRPANAAVIAPMEGVKARLQVSTAPGGDRRLLPNLTRIVRTLGLTRGLYRGAINRCVCAYGCVYACVNVCARLACVHAMCSLFARRSRNFVKAIGLAQDDRMRWRRLGADGAVSYDELGLFR